MTEQTKWLPHIMENPLTIGVRSTVTLYESLDFAPAMFLASLVSAVVLTIVLAIEIVLWPYGLIPVIASFLWSFVQHSAQQIRGTKSYMQKMPFSVSAGIYFAVWSPFGLLCLPFVIIGGVGQWLANQEASGSADEHEVDTQAAAGTKAPGASGGADYGHDLRDEDIAPPQPGEPPFDDSLQGRKGVAAVDWVKP